jgi:hypothetical protein
VFLIRKRGLSTSADAAFDTLLAAATLTLTTGALVSHRNNHRSFASSDLSRLVLALK